MLVDFAGVKIFDAITVDANILLSQKATNILTHELVRYKMRMA